MIQEILDYIANGINDLGLSMPASEGSLPPSDGIAVYQGAGAPTDEFLDRGKEHELYITVNAKNADQTVALGTLETIHKHFTTLKAYTPGGDYEIINIATGTAPNYLGKDANNQQWLYGSILKVTVYQTKE